MHSPDAVQIIGAALFAVAVLHTFATGFFEHLARAGRSHAGIWRLLGEVEVVFGFWAFVLLIAMAVIQGPARTTEYLDGRRFTEPMFVFAIMVIAGSRPVIELAGAAVRTVARAIPVRRATAFYAVTLTLVPLLGSLITEPAAMTLAALLLRDVAFGEGSTPRLRYVTLGVLFVNVSIGGTLTPFAAPPVLMVAHTWNWDLAFMLHAFGWRAASAVFVNAVVATVAVRRALSSDLPVPRAGESVPTGVVVAHIAFLAGVVMCARHPAVFVGILLLFLGFTQAYERYQSRLLLREGLMVAFFLAGLVVLGGMQEWWLQPLLAGTNDASLYFGATALTSITDNAALTYLASLVGGLSAAAQYAIVAGAVTGGGLTIIANAPNPAGFSLLKDRFDDGAIQPARLFLAALPPTIVAIIAFWVV